MPVTLVRNADWAVAFDGQKHLYRRDCDVAFDGDRIVHVGPGSCTGRPTRTIDGRGLMVMPGLVNIHSHPASEPLNKGWNDEIGSAKLYGSSLYEFMPLFRPDAEGAKAARERRLLRAAAVRRHDAGRPLRRLAGLARPLGQGAACAGRARADVPLGALVHRRTAIVVEIRMGRGRRPQAPWTRRCGSATRPRAHPSGRLSGMVAPAQIDTCTADLIRDSYSEAAQERGLPFQIHAAQSVVEFHEITRRHGMTPVEWLESLGVLSGRSIIGHGIFLDHHPGADLAEARRPRNARGDPAPPWRIARWCSSAAASP